MAALTQQNRESKHEERLNRKEIRSVINKGTRFLIEQQNNDGGVKFEDQRSKRSGVWVTAETIEFLLLSKTVPITVYEKLKSMIGFILKSQNEDGSWSILAETDETGGSEQPSAIATGHCIYILKLLKTDEYYPNKRAIDKAIKCGEEWLKHCCCERDDYAFWTIRPVDTTPDTNTNVETRASYVFSSYYAVLGLVPSGTSSSYSNQYRRKAARFFEMQARYFSKTYGSENTTDLSMDGGKIASTICRIICMLRMLKWRIPEDISNSLLSIISKVDPFTTTSIFMNAEDGEEFNLSYNNNTPFDVANALIASDADAATVKRIVKKYIEQQSTQGYWFLNFRRAFTRNTWPTAEALIVLEKALDRYDQIEQHEIEVYRHELEEDYRSQIESYQKEYKTDIIIHANKWRRNALITIGVSIFIIVISLYCISDLLDRLETAQIPAPTNMYGMFVVSVIGVIVPILMDIFTLWKEKKPKQDTDRKDS